MYRRTVLRSSSTRRAMAETLTPWRCSSRIMTISPSRTNDASPEAERGHHRSSPPATAQGLEAHAVSPTGEFSTGTSGDYSAGTHSRNPDLAAERTRKREELLAATEKDLAVIKAKGRAQAESAARHRGDSACGRCGAQH